MYADRRGPRPGIDRRSAGIAVALNAAALAALLLAKPELITTAPPKPPLTIKFVPLDPVPPPERPVPPPEHVLQRPVPIPPVPLPPLPPLVPPLAPTSIDPIPAVPLGGLGGAPMAEPSATPTPIETTAASIDPRHRDELQPTYPAAELRAGHQGVVTVRVLVGVDGRVRQVERVTATSDAFFRATEERALARWRFRPATRGGVPVEGWQVMTIRFVIPD